MNREEAEAILANYIQPNGRLYNVGGYVSWNPGNSKITLDGEFTAEELEAMAWWMKNEVAES